MNQKKTLWILVLALVLLIVGAGALYKGLSGQVDSQQLATQGETVTVAAGTDSDATEAADAPIQLLPDFDEKAKELEGTVQFLMVNLTDGSQETVETASAFIAEQGYTFPVFYDTDQSAAAAYGVYAVPVTYFIDAEGYGIAYASGAISADILQQGIDMICE